MLKKNVFFLLSAGLLVNNVSHANTYQKSDSTIVTNEFKSPSEFKFEIPSLKPLVGSTAHKNDELGTGTASALSPSVFGFRWVNQDTDDRAIGLLTNVDDPAPLKVKMINTDGTPLNTDDSDWLHVDTVASAESAIKFVVANDQSIVPGNYTGEVSADIFTE
ncbi:TPA: hypothetical protein KNH08_001900 [Serratia fonticola]|nr:hypothetical protein [Serratia fonticola]